MTTTNPWSRLPSPFYTALDSAGVTLPGALLYFYSSGTSTPLATYSDGNLSIANTNPVVADSGGRFGSIFLQSAEYKVVLKNSSGVEQWTADPVSAFSFGGNRVIGSVETIALARALATVGAGMITGDLLFINGHLATGDGGNRTMRWVSTSSATDNSATVLKPTDVSGNGRWLLVGDKNPYIFGAVGNGSTDDGAALQAYFTDGINGAFDFGHRGLFLSNQALSCQARRCNWRGSKIKFNIANHTDNCLTLVAVGTLTAEDGTRFYHNDLVIEANATGLDALYIAHGSPIIDSFQIFNSYRDSIHVHPKVTSSQWIENMTITNILQQGCGRHAMHVYIEGDGVNGTFVNESWVAGWEIRSIGVRFTNSNALRFTYDAIALASQTKVGDFNLFNCAWDCQQASSLAGAGVGNPIYHDCINGSTLNGAIESLNCWKIFCESTDTVVAGKKFLDASYTINSTHFAQCSLHVSNYQWFSGVPDGFLANYGNSFKQNVTGSGLIIEVLGSRPTGFLLYGDGTDGNTIGYMDAASVKNAPAVWVDEKDMIASANITFVIPIRPLSNYTGIGVDYAETAVEISLQNWGRVTDETYRYRTTWEVTPCRSSAGTAYCYNESVHSQAGGDLTRSFTAANVTFAITSSSGVLQDQITVTVPGGANVGAGGLVTRVVCMARRKHCVYEPPNQLLKGITAI